MIYNKDYREIIDSINIDNTLIIIDPPYNVGWKYDSYKDNLTDEEYSDLFVCFEGYKLVVIHYIEDIIKYLVPIMGVPEKVVQWIYNSNLKRQHRSIAFFKCKPDLSKVKQKPKNPEDLRVNQEVNIYDWWNVNLVKNVSKQKENYCTQIPEKIISNIIQTTAKDEIIFDAFMGTGTTLAVASKLGYKYIGCDVSPTACKITKKRLYNIENNLFNQKITK